MHKPRISMIMAMDEHRGIGKDNGLMWKIPGELARFKEITMGHPIIMGRKTFESIGRLLPGRTNIIITRDTSYKISGAEIDHSFEEAIEKAKKIEQTRLRQGSSGQGEIFIIGGGQIFAQALSITDRLYLTLVKGDFKADTFFPDYSEFKKIISRNKETSDEYKYTFLTLER